MYIELTEDQSFYDWPHIFDVRDFPGNLGKIITELQRWKKQDFIQVIRHALATYPPPNPNCILRVTTAEADPMPDPEDDADSRMILTVRFDVALVREMVKEGEEMMLMFKPDLTVDVYWPETSRMARVR
jgi:hypothetical protein